MTTLEAPLPKRPRRLIRFLTILLAVLLFIPVAAFAGLNVYVNDRQIPVTADLFPAGAPRKLLVIFPHPDDEVTIAGTISLLRRAPGTQVTIAHLTHGEKGPTGNIVSRENLGAARADEAKAAAKLLGAEEIMLDYPDGGLTDTDPAKLKATIRSLIQQVQPSVILTYDDRVGLYGHPDHVLTGRYVREVFEEDQAKAGFPVQRVYATTLPQPMIDLALKVSKTFRERYPKEPGQGLPAPTVAVKMAGEATVKGAVVRVHKTQWQVMGDLQPLYDKITPWLYYRLFDREYFTLVESR
jgi:LmbE family N-acetylglucosaminyl deacetylase